MTAFIDYARYYNLIYRDKDYGAEAGFVMEQLAEIGSAATGGSDLALLPVAAKRHYAVALEPPVHLCDRLQVERPRPGQRHR